jgi:hypothetical protein
VRHVRFGTDPKRSALGPNCKAHDLDNLYVVDASFFPSSSAVNPGLTTIANALRIGDHLLERLGAPSATSGETNGLVRADTQTPNPTRPSLGRWPRCRNGPVPAFGAPTPYIGKLMPSEAESLSDLGGRQ